MKYFILISLAVLVASCEVIVIDPYAGGRIVGTYQMREYSATNNSIWVYDFSVSRSGNHNLYIENFYDAGLSVRVLLDGNRITIPWQVRDGYEIEGSGTVNGNQIQMNFKVTDTYDYAVDFCSGSALRY